VDNGVLQRGNYFLVAESMLVVAFAGLLAVADKNQTARFASTVIATFGLLLTVAWTYVGHRHWRYLKFFQQEAADRLPYYQTIRAARPRNPISTSAVMTWLVPIFAGLMWTLFLFIS
jgi:hypothetical protein